MSQATKIKKHDYIIVKNHPEYEGEIYQVKRIKPDGWAITAEGHLFEPSFFDPVSSWQEYNGGFARFNSQTNELVEQRCIKKYLLQRFSSDGLDEWVTPEIIASEMGLDEALIEQWLVNNESAIERDGAEYRYKRGDFTSEIETKIKELSERALQPVVQKEARLKKRLDERLLEWEAALNFKIGDRVTKDDKQGNLADWSVAGDIIQAMVLWNDMTVPVPESVKNLKVVAPTGQGRGATPVLAASEQSEVKFLNNAAISDEQILNPTREQKLKKLEKEILEIKQVILNSFYELGIRLAQIRDEKLYELKNYKDFKDYVQGELSFTRTHAYRQIDAAQVVKDIFGVSPNWGHEKIGDPSVSPNWGHEKTGVSSVSPNWGHEKTGVSSVSPNCIRETILNYELKESHLRPLTDESLTPQDRRQIWENVEIELDDRKSVTGKPAKLTSKLVEKTVWEFKSSGKSDREPLFSGQICKVELKSNIDSPLKKHNNKLVFVVEQGLHGVKCTTFWNEPIEDYFYPEELNALEDEDFYSSSISLPVEVWKKLSKKGRSLNEAIRCLLE